MTFSDCFSKVRHGSLLCKVKRNVCGGWVTSHDQVLFGSHPYHRRFKHVREKDVGVDSTVVALPTASDLTDSKCSGALNCPRRLVSHIVRQVVDAIHVALHTRRNLRRNVVRQSIQQRIVQISKPNPDHVYYHIQENVYNLIAERDCLCMKQSRIVAQKKC